MSNVIILTEEQAVEFERAGFKVDVQYVLRTPITHTTAAPTPEPSAIEKRWRGETPKLVMGPAPSATSQIEMFPTKRKFKGEFVSTNVALRWTGLTWQKHRAKDTALYCAYNILNKHFETTAPILTRRDLNAILSERMHQAGHAFFSSTVTTLIRLRYLEPTDFKG